MSTRVSASNLSQALQDLMIQWQRTETYWRDVKSREFAHRYLENLPDNVVKAKAIIDEIDGILRKARKDCE
ncbi:MAG: hypothetical protein WCN98_03845 [Verrucomicrobiaceae bacterium]